jgi:hypothetical protein
MVIQKLGVETCLIEVSYSDPERYPHLKAYSDFMFHFNRVFTTIAKLDLMHVFMNEKRDIRETAIIHLRDPYISRKGPLSDIASLHSGAPVRLSEADSTEIIKYLLREESSLIIDIDASPALLQPMYAIEIVSISAASLPVTILKAGKGPIDTLLTYLLYGDKIGEAYDLNAEYRRCEIARMKLEIVKDYLDIRNRIGEESANRMVEKIDERLLADIKRLLSLSEAFGTRVRKIE